VSSLLGHTFTVVASEELWIVRLPSGQSVLSRPWVTQQLGKGVVGLMRWPTKVIRPGQVITLNLADAAEPLPEDPA